MKNKNNKLRFFNRNIFLIYFFFLAMLGSFFLCPSFGGVFGTGRASAATYYVSPTGDNSDGTTPEKAKNTITDGMSMLSPLGGDTLYIKGGVVYREAATSSRNGATGARHTVYFDWTGTGTTRSRLASYQAKIYGSVNSENAAYKWTSSNVGKNLLSNAGLETFTGTADDNTTDNWTTWAEETSGDAYIGATTDKSVGSYAAKIFKGTGNASLIYYNVSLQPNTSYTLTFNAKSDGVGTGSPYIVYTYSGTTYYLQDNLSYSTTANYTINGQGIDIGTGDTAYTTRTLTFTTAASNTGTPQNYSFYFRSGTNNGAILIDSVSLAPTTSVATTYYMEAATGGDPSLSEPNSIFQSNGDDTFSSATKGTAIASLANHQWQWGNEDDLGYNTIYYRDDSGNPDVTGENFEIPQRNNALNHVYRYYDFYGGIFRFGNQHGIECTSTNPASYNRFYNFLAEYNSWHGFSAYGDDNYVYYSIARWNDSKGFQNHGSASDINDPTMDLYLYNCLSYANHYNYVTYGKLHMRNCISYAATVYEFYKQVTDPSNEIDPDEQNNLWYSLITHDRNFGKVGEGIIPSPHITSIISDPIFISSSDYSLQSTSPAIDAGTDVSLTTDYAGNPIYGLPDIGGYEFQPSFEMGTDGIDITAGARIYGDGKFRDYEGEGEGDTANLSVAPESGSFTTYGDDENRPFWMDITDITWGSSYKEWKESSDTLGATNTLHAIGNLTPGNTYTLTIDSNPPTGTITSTDCTETGTCIANGSGEIIFVYTGGYSEHTFGLTGESVEEDESEATQDDEETDLNVKKVKATSTPDSITIEWKTDHKTKSTVSYGTDKNLKEKKKDNDKEKKHKMTLTNLLPNTRYYFRIKAKDGDNNEDKSRIHTIRTKADQSSAANQNQTDTTQTNQTTPSYSQSQSSDLTLCSYTVEEGDTLWSIAKKVYGDATNYPQIIEKNQDKYPNIASKLSIGQELVFCENKVQGVSETKTENSHNDSNNENSENQTQEPEYARWWNPFSWF
jgi:LysM repeat protein